VAYETRNVLLENLYKSGLTMYSHSWWIMRIIIVETKKNKETNWYRNIADLIVEKKKKKLGEEKGEEEANRREKRGWG